MPLAARRASGARQAAWLGPLGLGLLLVALAALAWGGDEWRLALRYDRAALADGQWWRAFTAHAVHLGWAHAALNMAGIALCAVLAPALFARPARLAALLAAEALGISAGLWLLSPQVGNYAGFSGVLYGLFVAGLWPQRRDPGMAAALLVVVGWMAWQWLGGPLDTEVRMIGGHIVAIAHIYGAVIGALWLALAAGRRRLARWVLSAG
ncbi:MAG: rhombosortase [Comamonas sp.]